LVRRCCGGLRVCRCRRCNLVRRRPPEALPTVAGERALVDPGARGDAAERLAAVQEQRVQVGRVRASADRTARALRGAGGRHTAWSLPGMSIDASESGDTSARGQM
jgi:hypothetical protein